MNVLECKSSVIPTAVAYKRPFHCNTYVVVFSVTRVLVQFR